MPKITIKVQATMKKQKLKIEIQRQNGNTYLSFEVEPSLEKLFKKQSQEIRESISWKGLKFYFIPNLTQSENYKQLLANYRLIDDFGVTLYEERCFKEKSGKLKPLPVASGVYEINYGKLKVGKK